MGAKVKHTNSSPTASKPPKLSITERKVVKAKIKAELTDTPQGTVALEVFPNATPNSANVMMSRELKKVNVQEALEIALAEHDLTTDRLATVLSEAMNASKKEYEKDDDGKWEVVGEVPEHSIRLKAAGMAANWMGIGKQTSDSGNTNYNFINVSRADKSDYGL